MIVVLYVDLNHLYALYIVEKDKQFEYMLRYMCWLGSFGPKPLQGTIDKKT
jgi:hypothetical protein